MKKVTTRLMLLTHSSHLWKVSSKLNIKLWIVIRLILKILSLFPSTQIVNNKVPQFNNTKLWVSLIVWSFFKMRYQTKQILVLLIYRWIVPLIECLILWFSWKIKQVLIKIMKKTINILSNLGMNRWISQK